MAEQRRHPESLGPIDRWTVVHAGVGAAMGVVGVSAFWALAGAVAYELAEQVVEQDGTVQEWLEISGPEDAANVALDLAAYMAAWYVASQVRGRR